MSPPSDEERQRAAMAAKRLITPIQAALEGIRLQQRKKNPGLSDAEFDAEFRKTLNFAIMFVYVGLSLDLGLDAEQILSNTQNVINAVSSVRQQQK